MFENVINFIQETYKTKDFIPLHEPRFAGNEKKYLNECIDSTFVSSVGKFVDDAQEKIKDIQSKNRIPILVGGTMMYYKVLQDGLSELPSANDEVRNQIEQKAREIG